MSAEQNPTTRQAYSIKTFTEAYSVSRSLVFEELKSKRLVGRMVRGKRMIDAADAKTWWDSYANNQGVKSSAIA